MSTAAPNEPAIGAAATASVQRSPDTNTTDDSEPPASTATASATRNDVSYRSAPPKRDNARPPRPADAVAGDAVGTGAAGGDAPGVVEGAAETGGGRTRTAATIIAATDAASAALRNVRRSRRRR